MPISFTAHFKWQLNEGIGQFLFFDPLLSDDNIDAEHGKRNYREKKRPPHHWLEPAFDVSTGVKC